MTAGNASNTVFTAIPVGEDFNMSFSTDRFFHTINPADILEVQFKLYDARIIGDVGNPNPNAVIETVTRTASPNRFAIGANKLSVLVYSATLDTYSATASVNPGPVFRGELYGYVTLTVGGEETNDISRLDAGKVSAKLNVFGNLPEDEPYWDGYFFPNSVAIPRVHLVVTGNLTIT